MPHEIDIIGHYRDIVMMGDAVHDANNNVSASQLIGQKQKSDMVVQYRAG
ncbi:hypothetical protein GCM10009096_14140 [Parasphingorhabdus litoris]|uniref:Uncharacterized protein n=1 Tax=Parasphingorhabdus litoris TaxID=394733 RepID=A0ABP3K8Y3_9SPHN